MNMPVTVPAYAHALPPKGPTLLQLALAAIHAKKTQRDHLNQRRPGDRAAETRQDMLDDHAFDAAEEFFAALEEQTGIDKALFGKLAEIG